MDCVKCVTCEKCVTSQVGMRGKKKQKFKNVKGMTVFINRICNLRCRYCFLFEYARKMGLSNEMTLNTAKRMLTWLLASSTEKIPHFHYFGYEPLVSFDLIKAATEWGNGLLAGTERSFKWGITTNLTLVTPKVNRFLRKNNFYVLCSIDGTKKGHDTNRVYKDGSGSFDDAMRGLKRVLKWDHVNPSGETPGRTVRWTISPETIDQIVPGTELYLDLGVRHVAHEFVLEVEWTKKDLDALALELDKLIPIFIQYEREEDYVDFKPFRDGMRSLTNRRMGDRCGLAGGDIGANVEGELFLCHRFVDQEEHAVGSIYKGLNFKKIKELQTGWVNKIVSWDGTKDSCYDCVARMGCNGMCLATNYDTTGNMWQPSKTQCNVLNLKARAARNLSKALDSAGLLAKYHKRTKKGERC